MFQESILDTSLTAFYGLDYYYKEIVFSDILVSIKKCIKNKVWNWIDIKI